MKGKEKGSSIKKGKGALIYIYRKGFLYFRSKGCSGRQGKEGKNNF